MDIVWFAEIKWDYLKTRKQQIISRKPGDIRLLYLEPYVKGRRNRFSVRREGDIFCATVPFIKSVPGGIGRFALNQPLMRYAVDRIAQFEVAKLIARLGFDRDNLGKILSNIYSIRVASRTRGRFLLYDCNDAHASFPGMPSWSEIYFREASRKADAVFASSKALVASVSDARGSDAGVEYLGNGVDFARFQTGQVEPILPADLTEVRIIYIGALAPWVDFDSIRLLAERHPEWEIALVGPVLHGAEAEVARLAALQNVTRSEPVAYSEVPQLLRRYHIALIPFRYNNLTKGVNPNKLYEYLAAGLPVVTTRFSEEVRIYPDVVQAAEPGEPFVTACEAVARSLAGDEDHEISKSARDIARQHDWDNIAEAFWQRVNKLMTAH